MFPQLTFRTALMAMMSLERLLVTHSSMATNMFKNVCLGGTFDGIHAGHKLLFSEATRICSERLVVGVTDSTMIRKKVLWELIAPVEDRIEVLKAYLTTVKPNLTYHVVPISDIYGPTITEKELECIVVSEETVKGAEKVNQARTEKGWPELKIHVVNLLEDNNSSHRETMERLQEKKFSSSLMRIEKLGSILKPPKPNTSIPNKPYIIGLTGGIASGKTAIGKYLESLGFGYINYDLLGHKTYSQIGSPIYNQIVDYFGASSILDETTRHIDRSRLGRIIFGNAEKRKKLEEFVWPGIHALADEEVARLGVDHEVIVLESALLIESGQTKRVHQIWTSIVPPEEAIKRQIESRNCTREDAENRVNSQTDNLTRVKNSNAVFCSLWEPEFTQLQVRKCVKELREKYLSIIPEQ